MESIVYAAFHLSNFVTCQNATCFARYHFQFATCNLLPALRCERRASECLGRQSVCATSTCNEFASGSHAFVEKELRGKESNNSKFLNRVHQRSYMVLPVVMDKD